MEYKVKVTVLDKKLYPELQQEYCAVPNSGKCPCFYVGDEFIFSRNDEKDDFWHCGEGTLVKSGKPDNDCNHLVQHILEQMVFHSARKHGMPLHDISIQAYKAELLCVDG